MLFVLFIRNKHAHHSVPRRRAACFTKECHSASAFDTRGPCASNMWFTRWRARRSRPNIASRLAENGCSTIVFENMTTMPLHLSLDSMDPLLECMPGSFAQKQLPRGQLCGRVGWVATTAIAVESGGSPHHVQVAAGTLTGGSDAVRTTALVTVTEQELTVVPNAAALRVLVRSQRAWHAHWLTVKAHRRKVAVAQRQLAQAEAALLQGQFASAEQLARSSRDEHPTEGADALLERLDLLNKAAGVTSRLLPRPL